MAILGCVADDFTGAADMASFLKKGGMRTLLLNGVPEETQETNQEDAIVIALKTRTQETEKAVSFSLDALNAKIAVISISNIVLHLILPQKEILVRCAMLLWIFYR